MAEAADVVVALVVPGVFFEFAGGGNLERMRRGAQSDDRTAAIEIRGDVFHLVCREILETQKDDGQIGGREGFEAGRLGISGDDGAGLRIDVEQHGAFEALMLGQDACEGGQGFLRAILVIAREKNDVLALARASGALVHEGRLGVNRGGKPQDGKEGGGDSSDVHEKGEGGIRGSGRAALWADIPS